MWYFLAFNLFFFNLPNVYVHSLQRVADTMRLGLFPVLSCQRGSAEMIDQNLGKE